MKYRISAKGVTVRRIGRKFTKKGTVFGEAELKPHQWDSVKADPALIVEEIKGGVVPPENMPLLAEPDKKEVEVPLSEPVKISLDTGAQTEGNTDGD